MTSPSWSLETATNVQPWVAEPYKLLYWWDMEIFSAAVFQRITSGLTFLLGKIEELPPDAEGEPFHLDRYVTEQVFRFNNRATKDNPLNDGDRFALIVSQIVGRRITYKELTGKTEARPF